MAWWREPGSRPGEIAGGSAGSGGQAGSPTPNATSGTGGWSLPPAAGGYVAQPGGGYSQPGGGYTPLTGEVAGTYLPQRLRSSGSYTPLTGQAGSFGFGYDPSANPLDLRGAAMPPLLSESGQQTLARVGQSAIDWFKAKQTELAAAGQGEYVPVPTTELVRVVGQQAYPLHPAVPMVNAPVNVPVVIPGANFVPAAEALYTNVTQAQIPLPGGGAFPVGRVAAALGMSSDLVGGQVVQGAAYPAQEAERAIGGTAVGLKAAADWRAQGANWDDQWQAFQQGFEVGRRELGPVAYTAAFEQALQGARAIGGPESGTLAPLLEKPAPAAIETVQQARALAQQGVPLEEISYLAGNPVVEAVGQSIVDLLNFGSIGAAGRTLKARAVGAEEYMLKPTTLTHAQVDAQLARTVMEPPKGALHELGKTLLGTPPTTKADAMMEETADAMRLVTSSVPETSRVEALKAWVNAASPKAEEARAAQEFLNSNGFGALPESLWGKQTSVVMRKMLTDPETHVVNFGVFDKLAEGETVEKATAKIVNRLADVTSEYYAVEKAPGGVKSTRWVESNPVRRVQGSINGTLTTLYLGVNPGFVARNMISNLTLGALQGYGPFFNPAQAEAWMKGFGFQPVGMARGIGVAEVGKTLAPITEPAQARSTLGSALRTLGSRAAWNVTRGGPMNAVAQAVERANGYMFAYKGTRRYWENVWRVGKAIEKSPAVDALPPAWRRRIYGMAEMSLNPDELNNVEQLLRRGEPWRAIPDDVGREFAAVAPELGDEAKRIIATAETPEAAATALDRAMETYRQFGADALQQDAPMLHNADPTVSLIEQLRAVEGDEGADAFARQVARDRADRATARAMVQGQVTQGIEAAPLAVRVQVEEGSRLFQRRLAQVYQEADANVARGWAREVPWEQVFARNDQLWGEFFTNFDTMWRGAVTNAGDQARPLLALQHADNLNIAQAVRAKQYVGQMRSQYLAGATTYDAFREQAQRIWGQYTRYSVTNYDDMWRVLGGVPEQGPLAQLQLTATRRARAVLFQEMEAAQQAAGVRGRYALNLVNKDRRQLGMAPIRSLSELDEPGLELATASFKRRREAQAARTAQRAAPAAAGLDTAALDEYAASLGRDPATMTAEEWDRLGQELIDEAERYFGASAERQAQRGVTAAEREGATRGRLANETALPLAADEIRDRVVKEARNAQRQAKRQGNKARLRGTEQQLGREEAARMNQLADLGRQAQERAARLGMPVNPEQAVADVVDSLANVAPTRATLTAESSPRVQAAIDILKLEIQNAPAGALGITPQQITEVRKWLRRTRARMNQTRAVAGRVGTLTRDAILHNYADKRTADSLLSYGLMFHYWQTRTAKTLAVTMANNPALLARYLRYKEALAQVNQGLPKWWRDQIGVTIGDTGYFANLEQTLNPVYNMIGNDFQDVDKEGTPFGRAVEAIGNAGLGSVWTPVVWAHALNLAAQGDTAGADAWVGYLSSATRTFTYATALLRDQYPVLAAVIPPGGITLEPWLWGRDAQGALTYFQGADKYQRKRIGVATQGLVESGQLTPEQQMDTLYAQAGPGWDMAMQQEARMRGPAALVGFFFGQGFKGRQAWEAEVDRANQEWRDNIAPLKATDMAAYRAASDRFFEQYPFMSAVWMAGRNDERREYSYVRNVLNRIPPGKAGDAITEAAQLDGDLLRRFYDTQGFEGWSKQDHDRFMASILDIGATLKIPDVPTNAEWQQAKTASRAVYDERDRQWPNYEQDNAEYRRLRETDQAAATEYARTHGLFDAWDFARAQIVENPQLFAYYGDAGDLQKYAEDRMYAERDRQWPQFQEVNARYMSFPKGSQERKAILAGNPWLRQAWDWTDQQQAALAANPPTTPPGGEVATKGAEVRQDVGLDLNVATLPPTLAVIEQWRAPIEQVAQGAGIDPRVIATIVYLESAGDPNRIGRDQDTGLMQVVAQESGYDWAAGRPTQQELLNPTFNLQTGTEIFKGALDANGGDVRKALAQYNTGSPNPDSAAAQQYLALYDQAWQKLWGQAAQPGQTGTGYLASGGTPNEAGVAPSQAVAQAAVTGQSPNAPVATAATRAAGTYTPLTKFTPLRGQVARRAYYGGGGGGGGGGYSSAVLKRMSPALLAQLWQYFLNGAPLESGALNELATLGITDYDKLRPAFASGIPVTQRSSSRSNQYWRSW